MTPEPGRRRALVTAAVALSATLLALPFEVGRQDYSITLAASLVRAAGTETLVISSPLTLYGLPRLILESGTISLADQRRSPGSERPGRSLGRLQVDEATIRLVPEGAAAAAHDGLDHPLAPLVASLIRMEFDSLSLREARVVRQVSDRAETLGLLSAEIALGKNGHVAVTGSFVRDGETLSFETKLNIPAGSIGVRSVPIEGSIRSRLISADFSGRLNLGPEPTLSASRAHIHTGDMKKLGRWLGLGVTDLTGFAELTAEGAMEWTGSVVSFQTAQFVLDGNTMTGTLSLDLSGDVPELDGTLASQRMDLAPYLARDASDPLGMLTSLIGRDGAGQGATAIIPSINADLRLSATEIVHGGRAIGSGAATIEIKDRRLQANITEVELRSGGRGSGEITIDLGSSVPRYGIGGELQSLAMSSAVLERLGLPTLAGTASLSGLVAFSGRSRDEMLSSLSGRVVLAAPEGMEVGLGLERLLARSAKTRRSGWDGALPGRTDADWLSIKVVADSGRLETEAVELRTGMLSYRASGAVDLRQRTIDFAVTRKPLVDAQAMGLVPEASVRITGALDAPDIRAEPMPRVDVPAAAGPPG